MGFEINGLQKARVDSNLGSRRFRSQCIGNEDSLVLLTGIVKYLASEISYQGLVITQP